MINAYLAKTDVSYSINLTGNESRWQLVNITGLSPAGAVINTSSGAGIDGTRFNSAQLNERNIVITLRLNGAVEANRQELFLNFSPKNRVRFGVQLNSVNYIIYGYIETVECDYFTISEMVQISIICPDPYFKNSALQTVNLNPVSGAALSVRSPIPTGIEIVINVIRSISSFSIVDTLETKTQTFAFAYQCLAGDKILINTKRGERSIVLTRSGVDTNLFSSISSSSEFILVKRGVSLLSNNVFTYTVNGSADSDQSPRASVTVRYQELFTGV